MIGALVAAAVLGLGPPAPAFTIHDHRIVEASGIAASEVRSHVFYVQNDSGDSARFFAVDDRTGRVRAVFHVPGAVNHDWEDLAVDSDDHTGRSHVWLADIGDNDATRREVQLYRVDEPKVLADGDTARPDVWRLRYPGGPVNAESLFVDPSGRAYIVTKTSTGHSDVYAVPRRPDAHRVQVLRRIGSIALRGSRTLLGGAEVEATGAAMSDDGRVLVVRTYVAAYLWHVAHNDVAAALRTRPTVVSLPLQSQGEGICLTIKDMYVDSEGRNEPVWRVPLPKAFREPVADYGTPRLTVPPAAGATGDQSSSAAVVTLGGVGVIVVIGFVVFGIVRARRRG